MSSAGVVVPTNSSLSEIHHKFGETFRVEDENKWLFNEFLTEVITTETEQGMPYEANYNVFEEPVAPAVVEVSFGLNYRFFSLENQLKLVSRYVGTTESVRWT